MVANRRVTGKASTIPGGVAIGSVISMGLTAVLSGIVAKLADQGILPEQGIGYSALVILMLSSATGSFVAARMIKRQRLLVCLLAGAVYYLLLLGLTALFFGGQYTGMGVTALAVLAGSGTVCLLGMGQGRGRKHRIPEIHR